MTDVKMPRLGVSVEEGTLTRWIKQVGDPVEIGDPICEVATDKVDMEVESTSAGVLAAQLIPEGGVVAVGAPLARLGDGASSDGRQEELPHQTAEPVLEAAPEPPADAPVLDAVAPTAAPGGHAEIVRMPQMGVSVTEGTLSAWLRQVGDTVAVGDPLCEVSTDKVDTEIESTAAGVVLEHRWSPGDTVPVGEALAVVGDLGAVASQPGRVEPEPVTPSLTSSDLATPSETATQRSGRPAETVVAFFDHRAALADMLARGAGGDRVMAAPAARSLARELGVDLRQVTGSGLGGHVTRDDVREQAAAHRVPKAGSGSEPAAVSVPPTFAPAEVPAGPPAGYEDVPFEAVPTSRIRRVTAEHMSRSRRTAAHMTTEVDVDLGLLTEIRKRFNEQRAPLGQSSLSFLPYVARAMCAALVDHPDLNATFQTEQLIRWGQVNLGIAVDTPRGLMVPVIPAAERLTVEPLAAAIRAAAERVRDGRATPDDFRAGTFTISNPGSVGAVSAPAIINQPQVGILGMPTIVRRPWVVQLGDGQETIAIRPIIRLALTFDHRAVDGADATRCLVDVKRRLETWQLGDYR